MLAKTVRYSQDGLRLAMLLNFSQGSCVMFLLTGTSILAVSASTELYWQVATLPSSPNLENHHQGEGTRETNF
jgi:hypothetical protein